MARWLFCLNVDLSGCYVQSLQGVWFHWLLSLLIAGSWPSVQQLSGAGHGYAATSMKITHALLSIAALGCVLAIPAPGHARQAQTEQAPLAPHLMNDGEFALFLKQLDTGVLRWEAQLKDVDVKSLALDSQESEELARSYDLSLRSMENTREEIQKLLLKQTLRCDFLLLVDLNDLARNLDGLDRDLANPDSGRGDSAARKSLLYAKEVLGMDAALAPKLTQFQRHLLAFTGVIDASLEADEEPDQPPAL